MVGVEPESALEKAVALLNEAARTRVAFGAVRNLLRPGGPEQGYAGQQHLVRKSVDGGRRPVGGMIGLTSETVQKQLGVRQPDYGVLFADMPVPAGAQVAVDHLPQPRIEAEIALVLAADLARRPNPGKGAASDRPCCGGVRDSRQPDRRMGYITITDTIADNASRGLFALSDRLVDISGIDLKAVTMEMTDGKGVLVTTGTGAACLGNPLKALAWLARQAGSATRCEPERSSSPGLSSR